MSPIRLRMSWLTAAAGIFIVTGAFGQGTGNTSQPAPAANSPRMHSPPDAYVYIGWPQDGVSVGKSFKVWFGTRNFGVAPAGVQKANTGHHHLLIDVAELPPMDQPIPNDRNHLHFGLGQTETTVELPPGKHTLQLLMGDADHVPHDPPLMSRRITVYVRP
jgi:hypothetical protein